MLLRRASDLIERKEIDTHGSEVAEEMIRQATDAALNVADRLLDWRHGFDTNQVIEGVEERRRSERWKVDFVVANRKCLKRKAGGRMLSLLLLLFW